MRNLIHRWTKLGHFFPKSGHFLQFSRNGKGGVPPSLQLVAYMYRKNVCRVHYLFSYTDFFLSFLLFWCCCSCCYEDFSNDNLGTYYMYKAGKCIETSKSFKIKFASIANLHQIYVWKNQQSTGHVQHFFNQHSS